MPLLSLAGHPKALAVPVTFEVLSSDVAVGASALGLDSDQMPSVAISGTNGALLGDPFSPQPSLEFTGGSLLLGPIDLTLAGHVAQGRGLAGGSFGGPVVGSQSGPPGSETDFLFDDFVVVLDAGTIDVRGALVNSTRDLSVDPLSIPFDPKTVLTLSAALPQIGPGVELRLAIPVDVEVPVDLPGTAIPVTLTLVGGLLMSTTVAAPEPSVPGLLVLGLARLVARRIGSPRARLYEGLSRLRCPAEVAPIVDQRAIESLCEARRQQESPS